MNYTGYLAPFVATIRELHGRGATTRQIAEAIYAAGARARASDPRPTRLTREHHLTNLTCMTLYVLRRLGLHRARKRVVDLKARDGVWM